jgi:MEMO1 family protein
MKENVRAPAVAGMFYPSDLDELRAEIQAFLSQVKTQASPPFPKALIVPHAGYIYSGPIAASGYASLEAAGITRVVLLGPSHCVHLCGLAAPEAKVWLTPLGEVQMDTDALEQVSSLSQVLFSDVAHESEHCLEVQLPFLQERLGAFQLAPFVVGDAEPTEVAEVLGALWGGPETLVLISSDLSHYEPYDSAVKKDAATAQAILDLHVSGLESDCACGLTPIAGLVHLARQKGMRVEQLDLRNSGDTAGARDQVVGYGAFAFYD